MYREVTMLEVKEVLRLWREGVPTKRLAAQLGLDPKTVRRYLRVAVAAGLSADAGAVSEDQLRDVLLRHRFVYPAFEETTARAIEACEAAWDFFGGIFKVLIPDNTKAIITQADPLAPRLTRAFLDYAQARHFHIDAARVRHPRDKGRVERAVAVVRDDCFAGEVLATIEAARVLARRWCLEEYGLRRHGPTPP